MTVSEDSFVFSSLAPLDKIKVVSNGKGAAIFCSSGCDLFVYNVIRWSDTKDCWSTANVSNSWKASSRVMELVVFERRVDSIEESGNICRFDPLDGSLEDDDIFEMEESPEGAARWKMTQVCTLPGSPSVLSASVSKLGICVLANLYKRLTVFIVRNEVVARLPLVDCAGSEGTTCILNISDLSFDFMNLWLPHVERSEEFLVVGSSDGHVVCTPLALPLKCYSVYRSVHSVVSVSWFSDRRSERFDSLIVCLDFGAVIRLTPVGEEISFPFFPFLNSAIYLSNCIISINEYDSRFLRLSDASNKALSFPIKDVTSACQPNDKLRSLLVCDKDNKIHYISIDDIQILNESLKNKFDMTETLPRLSDLKQLIASSNHLLQINCILSIHDEYLRAKSLVSQAEMLKKHFKTTLKVIQILNDQHTLRLKISFDLPGIVFSKEFWKLELTVMTAVDQFNYLNDLVTNVSSEGSVLQLVTIPIFFRLMYDVECKLVSHVESKKIDLYLSIGKIEMDATYFVLPISLSQLSSPSEDSLMWDNPDNDYTLNITLDYVPSDVGMLQADLLAHSKCMWRNSEWKRTIGCDTVCCVLFGCHVRFTVRDNMISVQSRNLKVCRALTLAFLLKTQSDSDRGKEKTARCLMGWHQAESIIRLSSNPQEHITDLYNNLKNTNSYED